MITNNLKQGTSWSQNIIIFSPPVAALHAATALVDAVNQFRGVDSSASTTAQRQMTAATAITPSVAVSFVAAEHTATAHVNMVSQPHELNLKRNRMLTNETMCCYHMAQDPFANIHAELVVLRLTVDELQRDALPVIAVNMDDRNTPYHTEHPPVMQGEDHRLGLVRNTATGRDQR